MSTDTPLPAAVCRYLETLLLQSRRPAYAFMDREGLLADWGGPLVDYTGREPYRGRQAIEQFDFLAGMLPVEDESICVPHLITGDDGGRHADLHLVPDENGGTLMILVDATDSARQEQHRQQQANDLQLLRKRQQGMIKKLEAQTAHLEAVLDQLRVASMRISPDGEVEFVSAFASGLLGVEKIPDAIQRQQWCTLLPFTTQEAARFETLLAAAQEEASAPHERVRLTVECAGLTRWLEVDVRRDPAKPDFRIVYFYDVSEVMDLRSRLQEKAVFQNMVGKSEPMQRLYKLIRDVARVNATVLIEGETGTGKELAARALHECSPRKDGPFIVVNCAGFTDSLINSQLFGHKKGAFTDAVSDQKGVFEAADGGTILLDEIGDIPMNTQTRILRALEQREIIRVGETEARKVNIRILAATNKNLELEVKNGAFRPDLLYRIRVARVRLPPLRERREDIPLLVRTFAAGVAAENGFGVPEFSRDVLAALLDYRWPGNVRELRNAVEFAMIRCQEGVVRPADLPPEISDAREHEGSEGLAQAATPPSGKTRLLEALAATGGRRGEAARKLGISRATLYRRMKAYGLNEDKHAAD